MPVSPFVVITHPAPPVMHQRPPTALQASRPIPAPTSVVAFLGFYLGHTPPLRRLKHAIDQIAHRTPLRLPQRFLR